MFLAFEIFIIDGLSSVVEASGFEAPRIFMIRWPIENDKRKPSAF
jgi:hypothetical protein